MHQAEMTSSTTSTLAPTTTSTTLPPTTTTLAPTTTTIDIEAAIQQLIDAGWTEAPDCAPDHYPHETDCDKFYQCDHGYRSPDRVCSEGTLWHNAIKACDHAANTDCSNPPVTGPALGGDLERVLFSIRQV